MTSAALPRLRTVRLYGRLGSRFGRMFRLAVDSPAEAVRALCVQVKGFEQWLMESKDHGVGYAVFIGKRNLAEDELDTPPGGDDIRIAPMIIGSKEGGWFNIIVGAVLVVAGVAVNYFSAGSLSVFGNYLIGMGVSMIVGGVVQLLAPSPKGGPKDRPENTPSYAFSGPVNTQAQGNPVPVLYGELIIGSAVVSAGMQADDEVYIPDTTTIPAGGGAAGGGSPIWHDEWQQQVQ